MFLFATYVSRLISIFVVHRLPRGPIPMFAMTLLSHVRAGHSLRLTMKS